MNKTKFTQAWNRHVAEFGAVVPLGDTPAYPLARTVAMPQGHAYETGALSYRMTGLKLLGLDRMQWVGSDRDAAGERVALELRLDGVRLEGRYAVEAKYDPIVDLDTAGNLMDMAPEASRPTQGGADPDEGGDLDPQQEEWLGQARDQRTKLQQTENGQKLMGLYNEHNEVYEEVFRENAALTPLWRADGATKEMAADTHEAVKTDGVVNKSDKTYTGNLTYNANAFVQQLNVASACVWSDPDFDPSVGPTPDSKYWNAAKAALSFGKGVTLTTNNTKDNIQELKATDVHGTVQAHDQDLPQVSDEEMMDVIAQGNGPGGGLAARQPDWVVLDEQDRHRLRQLFEATMRQKAEKAAIAGQPLFEGALFAEIGGVDAFVELVLEAGPNGAKCRTGSVRLELPAYELDIDDSAWIGDAGQIARKRLESMSFIRSLLHDSIVDRLSRSVGDYAASAYESGVMGTNRP